MKIATLMVVALFGLFLGGLSIGCASDKPKNEAFGASEEAAVHPANKMCIVEKEHKVDAGVAPVIYQGKAYGFCCEDCRKEFAAHPEKFAAAATN